MITTLTARSQALFDQAALFLTQHPKRLASIVATLLVSGTGGALALASFAPDASELPMRLVVEPVQPAFKLEAAADLPNSAPLNLYRSDLTRSSDTANSLLTRLGIDDPQAARFLRSDTLTRQLLLGRSGRNVMAQADDGQRLQRLQARWSPDDNGQFKRLVVERTDTGFASRLESAPLTASVRLASGSIRSSLFAATDDAGLPDAIATQMAEIFSSDIDRFNVVYEVLEGDGEPMRTGRVLSAEFVNAGKTFQAMWFQPPGHDAQGVALKGGYYTLDGQSKQRAFLSSPVEFSRVSSGFAMRFHPVLQHRHRHPGAHRRRRRGVVFRQSKRLWQRGLHQTPQQHRNRLCAPQPDHGAARPKRGARSNHRPGRGHRLGHRATPAL